MVARLLTALRRLAAATPARSERAPDIGGILDEVGREFADAWLLARQCPGLEWTSAQRALLDELDERLDRLIGRGKRSLSTEGAGTEWAGIPALARQALVLLGEGTEQPRPPSP
ncbi:MAG TPA: hypothetical protein VEB59_07315 [Gemmatimonadales bacterium]|nr:hypothetical protein [Gemmatimonadales bacterium]